MDRPCSLGNNPELDILKAKVAHLQAKISASDTTQKNTVGFDDVVEIMQNEIRSHKDQIEFETVLKQKLLKDDERLSRYIQEDEHVLRCADQYLEKATKLNESILDERKELYFKLELLHRQLLRLIKKFSKRYFPPQIHQSDDLFDDVDANEESEPKKSLLDIFSTLLTELSGEENAGKPGILHVDDTVWKGDINFLICANIIERCPEDPNYVKLK